MKYSPQTGLLYGPRGKPMKPGKSKYIRARIGKQFEYVHRLAFQFMGVDIPPNRTVDHINRNGNDNRWENLRLVTHRGNMLNRRDNRKVPGINRNGKRWVARLYHDGFQEYLGSYDCPLEAYAAYRKASNGL